MVDAIDQAITYGIGSGERFDPVTLTVGGLVIAVLQTDIKLKRDPAGHWSFELHKKAMRDSTLGRVHHHFHWTLLGLRKIISPDLALQQTNAEGHTFLPYLGFGKETFGTGRTRAHCQVMMSYLQFVLSGHPVQDLDDRAELHLEIGNHSSSTADRFSMRGTI